MELGVRSIYKNKRPIAAVTLGTGVAFVVVLLAIGGAGGQIRQIRLGPVSFEYASPWHETSVGEIATHGLHFTRPLGLKAPGRELVAGMLQNGTPTPGGLPRPALAAFKTDHADRSQLRNSEATAYSGPKKHGDELLTIYIVPTAKADIGIVCTQAPEAGSSGCLGIAKTLRVLGPRVIPVGPDKDLDGSLTTILEPVVSAHQRHQSVAGSAGSVRAVADHLADLDLKAGQALDGMNVEPRSQDSVSSLSASLAAESRHLRKVAKYVHRAHGGKYGKAVDELDLDHRAILGAIDRLRQEGLTVPPVGSIAVAPTPGRTSAAPRQDRSAGAAESEGSSAVNEGSSTAEGGSTTEGAPVGEGAGGSSESTTTPHPESHPPHQGIPEIKGHVEHAESLNSGGIQ